MQRFFYVGMCLLLAAACAPLPHLRSSKKMSQYLAANAQYEKTLVGLCIYDMDKKIYLAQQHHDKYFTPASTTKLFTFYTALKILGSSPSQQLPAFEYVVRPDSLIVFGTGNPTLLHEEFAQPQVLDFLRKAQGNIYFSSANWKEKPLGLGWSWDDYNYAYAAERSPMPLYGNLVVFSAANAQNIRAFPSLFQKMLKENSSLGEGLYIERAVSENRFEYSLKGIKKAQTDEVPFVCSDELTAALLADTLKRTVKAIDYPYRKAELSLLESFGADSLYRRMLQPSDNQMAEQILLMCAGRIGDGTMNTRKAIDYMLGSHLKDLSDKPRWVDGSGLSRMNLFTPRSQVELLLKIYGEVAQNKEGEARLFSMLAIGGKAGTLRNLFKQHPPFVYAKTGTLSNNACLSGYLITQSGKRLCFSIMNNHFLQPTATIRSLMEQILTEYYLHY